MLNATRMTKALAVIAVLLCGCDLYFGGGGDDVPCSNGGAAEPDYAQWRNPQTGQCESVPLDHPCFDSCGACDGAVGGGAPGWGRCYSMCTELDEQTCLATSNCLAAYLDDPATDGNREFWGCWGTSQGGGQPGQCESFDAERCSGRDDCIAIYSGIVDGMDNGYPGTKFAACATEPDGDACDVINCGTGYHCEEQCYPSRSSTTGYCEAVCVQDLTCASVDCGPGYTCTQVCTSGTNGTTTCHPACLPQTCGNSQNPCPVACELLPTEAACTARTDCMPVYDGDQCTCYPTYCECQVLTYDHCETP